MLLNQYQSGVKRKLAALKCWKKESQEADIQYKRMEKLSGMLHPKLFTKFESIGLALIESAYAEEAPGLIL